MNISFDLDRTLIPSGENFETERRNRIAALFGIEELRKGTRDLIFDLQNQGHQINIYTTSFRSKRKIRWTLRYYGICVNRIVNQTENSKVLKANNVNASKHPKLFNFDLHIDDSEGVGIEANRFNFNSIIIDPNDMRWVEKVKEKVRIIAN